MYSIKLFAKDDHELNGIISNVNCITDDIGMDLQWDECAKITFKKERITETDSIDVDFDTAIRKLEQEVYNYLGISEGNGMQVTQMEKKVKKKEVLWC